MSSVIKLRGNNKKLMQQCGNFTKLANKAADIATPNTFKILSSISKKKLTLIAYRLNVDTRKYFVAPNITWDGLVLILR